MDLIELNSALLREQKLTNYAGYDPFDGLNSRLFKTLQLNRFPLLRLIWLQAFKVLPINLRPLTGVPRMRNPKGIALFILGLLEDYKRTNDPKYLSEAIGLANWLIEESSPQDTWDHACWGYHFDWQARAFFVPKGKPNVITTSYIASALHELFIHTSDERFLDYAVDAGRFVSKHLIRKTENGELFYGYIPGEETFVHNASLWGAATVARTAKYTENPLLKEEALSVAQLSANSQLDTGAWVYGTRSHHQFIDGFHTGYNLEALYLIDHCLNTNTFENTLSKGLSYYKEYFFLKDGTPKYYQNQTYPIDIHSFAQAIITFGKLGKKYNVDDHLDLMDSVLEWTINHMYMPNKTAFRYQINKLYKNNVIYCRWTQAWAYYAIAFNNRLKSVNEQ